MHEGSHSQGEWISLDGSEGGGQLLRTALSCSMVTGHPFRMREIRAGRKPAGLRPQHLACVRGAVALCDGRVEGARVGASEIEFQPGPVRPGSYQIDVGTAGSAPLVVQCLFFPLALAGGGALNLRGGTHLPRSPVAHYLARVWASAMRWFGLSAEVTLRYAGFYPEGAGELQVEIAPPVVAAPRLERLSRGTLKDVAVVSMVANLPFDIAERQADAAVSLLARRGIRAVPHKLPLPTTRSTGTVVFIQAEFEHSVAAFTALGEKGRRAEEVGAQAVEDLGRFMESSGAVDRYLADQLLLPAALGAAARLPGGPKETTFVAEAVTEHLRSNAAVLETFLPVRIELADGGRVTVVPRG